MSYQQEKFKEIADAIREKTGTVDLIKPSEFADKIEDVYIAGQNTGGGGYDKGFEDGKKSEYDRFWNAYQNNGQAVTSYMFYGTCWTDEVYKPKYPIVFNTGANAVFGMSKITDTKVAISIPMSGVIQTFYGSGSLITIPSLTVTENTTFSSWFSACKALRNITIHGTIANDISFSVCPLSKESVESIVSALSDGAKEKTITLNEEKMYAIQNEQTDAGNYNWFDKLTATKTNWTFALA